jgi:hypothetical protein
MITTKIARSTRRAEQDLTSYLRRRSGSYRVTAVLNATSSTLLHSDTTRRTPDAHMARSGQASACIC